ncbi:PEGA domain-containing protein [Candidatus Zixiibacteriota bacterium]
MSVRFRHILYRIMIGLLALAASASILLNGCGQKDPTQPLTGKIYVLSDSTGATIILDGEDTGQVTPDTLSEVAIGPHVVKVRLSGFVSAPESLTVQVNSGQVVEALFALNEVAGSRRLVLLEHFTSVNCGPCPEANEVINGVLEDLGSDWVIGVEYHPWPADPFYNAASPENIARNNYYGVTTIPVLFVGGLSSPDADDSLAIVTAVEARSEITPQVAITVTDTVAGQSWSGAARLIGLEDVVSSDLRGFFVVLEREIHMAQAPGTNGEKDFYYVMRKILPDPAGEVLNISSGDTLTIFRETDLHPDSDPDQIYSIYFIQDYLGKEVLQAGTTLPH